MMDGQTEGLTDIGGDVVQGKSQRKLDTQRSDAGTHHNFKTIDKRTLEEGSRPEWMPLFLDRGGAPP